MITKIEVRRRQMGLTVREAAVLVKVSSNTYRSWETGASTPNVLVAFSVAKGLGSTVDELWDERGAKDAD